MALGLAVTGCSSNTASSGTSSSAATVSVTNCNNQVSYPSPTTKIFANDSSTIGMMVAIGAHDSLVGVSSMKRDQRVFEEHYGPDAMKGVEDVAGSMPSLETIVARNTQLVVAGWNYGFKDGGVTPDALKSKGIDSYVLSVSCLQKQGEKARGIMEPWTALGDDLTNLGRITGNTTQAQQVLDDVNARKDKLAGAPQAATAPNVLMFDSGDKTVFTSGKFAAPQAIITAAGGRNVMDDVDDSWTTVSWERIAATNPDVIVFDDYGTQTFAQKVAMLESNDSTKNLPAVKNKRYLNLPYAMWVSSPLNIDAAEQLRHKMEQCGLEPKSDLPQPRFDDDIAVSATS
ncbi:ABC transporter substrate-binding protein [Propionibacterium freudenreichii]|uniref:ABC transporter substrate-binding protein n=1 Tax=Propionibacterium freudenreichii TaxID=1744 RepID=UPI00254E9CCB|nr:ABC transporter substrate-binding protein [Propionibacterium freudenreichii]